MDIEVQSEGEFAVKLRVPGWCEEGASVEVDGAAVHTRLSPGTYLEVRRLWRSGDTISLNLPMPVRRVECHPHVAENEGRVALMRGPLLYCVEQTDTPGVDLRDLMLESTQPGTRARPELLGGVVVLEAEARTAAPDDGWRNRLYRTVRPWEEKTPPDAAEIKAIPYYAWASREPGAMRVWLKSR